MTDSTQSGNLQENKKRNALAVVCQVCWVIRLFRPQLQGHATADAMRNVADTAGRDIRALPIEWIVPGPWQPRRNFDLKS